MWSAKWFRRIAPAILLLIGLAAVGRWLSLRWYLPYGWSHSCDKMLILSIRSCAETNGEVLPTGEATPEASLSLLYPDYLDAAILRGKSVPESLVKEILERGDRLGPESCGWHYVDGLTLEDDPHLAVFWDKAGLGHNGQRLWRGGHVVSFLNCTSRHVTAAEWPQFIEEQETLLAGRKRHKEDDCSE